MIQVDARLAGAFSTMDNSQFRKLLLANSKKKAVDKNGASTSTARPGGGTPAALGSRQRSSIPMTPRSVAGAGRSDFTRQLAEREKEKQAKSQQQSKMSAPKGSRLAKGYTDRTMERQDDEDDERALKLKELQESLKREDIDQETYDRLQGEIAGGDLSSTHLVKGLDFKLLERVRRGEDVYDPDAKKEEATQEVAADDDAELDEDDELDRLEATEVQAVDKEKIQKKGQLATSGLNPGQKRSRNQILAEMKAVREAAKAKELSGLGSKFKKIGAKKAPGTRIERDNRGREVMIIVDEDGHERRKVRKVDAREESEREMARLAFVPDKNAEVLGMDVPEFYKQQQKEKELEAEGQQFKLFEEADSDYDPLADLEGGSDDEKDSSDEENPESKAKSATQEQSGSQTAPILSEALATTSVPSGAKKYFKDSKTGLTSEETYKAPSMDDPSFLAGLRKARALGAQEKSEEEQKAADQKARLKKLLENSSRDDEDLDMGFGTNRMEDEADLEDAKIKLSAWGEDNDDEEHVGGDGGKPKRKRGGQKRKGDKDSFADVMAVMERNKSSAS